MRRFFRTHSETIVDFTLLILLESFLIYQLRPDLLFIATTITGGDIPSFVHPARYLKNVLIPGGNLLGWDPYNFAGYPPFQFYNLLPFALIVLFSTAVPYEIAVKLVTVVGILLLPLAAYSTFRLMQYEPPIPVMAAISVLAFLFNRGNAMWGGNILSTLAGEFTFSLGLALAVAFWGGIWWGIRTGRGAVINSVLLALTGLSHPIAFIYAALAGTYFMVRREAWLSRFGYLLRVYLGGTLLMSFWLIPLLFKLEYTTKINWIWTTLPFSDLFPTMLLPFFILAVLNLLVFIFFKRFRDDRTAFFLYSILANGIVFFNATTIGLPEIRFVPVIQLMVVLLAVDLLHRLIRTVHLKPLLAVALLAAMMVWVIRGTVEIPNWIDWNYSGFEKKPRWETFHRLQEFIKGGLNDPRVFYEHATLHNQFGSIRAFEAIPYFSGRSTLEGALLQTAVNSPFIYYIQSETSKEPSHVIPGYSYSRFNLERGTKHLEMYNVSLVIAESNEVKKWYDAQPFAERVFEDQEYAVYRLKSNRDQYVIVPPFQPVLLRTSNWKQDFHRWFSQDSLLDIPIVSAQGLASKEYSLFEGPVDRLDALPRRPIPNDCRIHEQIESQRIEFTTNCPGRPHIIRMSYFPNWKVEGAARVYLVSPAFMLVYPDGERVTLTYGRTASDYIGLILSLSGLAAMIGSGLIRRFPALDLGRILRLEDRFEPTVQARLQKRLSYAAIAVLFIGGAAGVANYFGQGSPQRIYERAWSQFNKAQYEEARVYFQKLRSMDNYDPMKVTGTFFVGQTYFREENYSEALKVFQELVNLYPEDSWVPETLYHIGVCLERLGRIEEALKTYDRTIQIDTSKRWADLSREKIQEITAGGPQRTYDQGWALFDKQQYKEAREFFQKLRRMDGDDPMKVTGTFFVGQTYFREENNLEALKIFRELVNLYPESIWVPETLYHIGFCLERLGRNKEALQSYNKVIQMNKSERWANFSKKRIQQISSGNPKR